MPKVASHKEAGPLSSGSKSLRRNHACHQCRKRKMKCDARRPLCSTCERSHAHVKSQPLFHGVMLHNEPECTWDDLPDPLESPKHQIAYLKNKICELEAKLAKRPMSGSSSVVDYAMSSSFPITFGNTENGMSYQSGNSLLPVPQADNTMSWTLWPLDLPGPEELHSLVEAFFSFHPHATRLIHQASFTATLSFPAYHPKFPSTALLHAICGLGKMYSNRINGNPFSSISPNEEGESSRYSEFFSKRQIELAQHYAAQNILRGSQPLESLQALIIVGWYYWYNANWIEVYMTTARILRGCAPLGLHRSTTFHPLTNKFPVQYLLPPSDDPIERETRCNVFWLAYALERMSGCGNDWPSTLDDIDVTQHLPIDTTNSLPRTSEREHPMLKNVLISHKPAQTDSFLLFIKGSMLLSRVKNYNLRYDQLKFTESPVVELSEELDEQWQKSGCGTYWSFDQRRNNAFIELDQAASGFVASIPAHLESIPADYNVDVHLYGAKLASLVALILLHDPHAHIEHSACPSTQRLLDAAHNILKLIVDVQSKDFDASRIDSFCFFAWFLAGRSLVRFWDVAQRAGTQEQVDMFRAEVQYIADSLKGAGNDVPLAGRYSTMLSDSFARIGHQDLQL